MKASILLVDDHPVFLKGLRDLLEDETDMKVVGEAGEGKTALKMVQQLSPDVVVMDITMPGLNGIDTTKKIISDHPDIKVIALSIHSGKEFVEGMLKAGANGYIVKESVPEELVNGIRLVMEKGAYLSPSITGMVVSQFRKPFQSSPHDDLMDIVATKLSIPMVPKDHVHRPRLLDFLEKSRHLPIQTIIAPAGYGKSTLVASWVEKLDWPASWLSLDENDNDLRRFIIYFINAVHFSFPGALEKSLEFMRAEKLPPIQQIAGCLSTELGLIGEDFLIALDDVHLIKDKQIYDLLTEIFRHPPKYFHLILISRIDPFLPVAKLRAQRLLQEIRMNDLRFTNDEIQIFLNRKTQEVLEKHLVQEISKKTEGWITGITLAALSIRHQQDFGSILSELDGSPEYVMEYLFSEVLSAQPRQIIDYLIQTSFLNRFCTDLCQAILPDPAESESEENEIDALQFIAFLKKENMFIVKLSNDNKWYRYHHLFEKLLRQHLKREMRPKEIAALHTRAASWFEENGYVDEAIHHSLAAGDPDAATNIIEKNRISTIDRGQTDMLRSWLKKIPPEIKERRPDLLLGKAWVFFDHTRISEILPLIEQVESLIDERTSNLGILAEIYFFKGVIHYFQENSSRCIQYFIEAAKQIPNRLFLVLNAETECWTCMALHANGQKDQAIQKLHGSIRKRDIREGILLSRLTFALCFIHILEGEFLQSLQENQRMKEVCRVNQLVFAETWAFFMEGNAALQLFDLKTADQCFSHVMENRYTISPRAALDAMAALAVTLQYMGRSGDEVDQVIHVATEYAQWANTPAFFEIIHSLRARISILRGNLESAIQWQRSVSQTEGDLVMLFFQEIPAITECRVLIASRSNSSLTDAVGRLDTLCEKTRSWNNTYQQFQCMVLQAVAMYYLGQTQEALKTIEQTVQLAGPGNWLFPFVEQGKPITELMKQLPEKDADKSIVSRILQTLDTYEYPNSSSTSGRLSQRILPGHTGLDNQPLIESLTNREMEILTLLTEHLYNKEIAERLFISIETVKTHLKRIYEKLDVGNRRDAVAKASKIGLITGI